MVARHRLLLTAVAAIFVGLATPVYAAPEGPNEAAPVAAATPREKPAAQTAVRSASQRTRSVRRARSVRKVQQVRENQPATRRVRPAVYHLASSAPAGCGSIACAGGVLLLGVGF